MLSMKSFFLKIFLLSIFFLFSACDAIIDSAVPIELDLQIGKSFLENAKDAKDGMRILKDVALEKYVKSVADRILKSDQIKYKKEFPYKISILDDDDTINAVCTPGGYIFVYTGLLKLIQNEATLAAILAHEIAHAEKRHSVKQIISSLGIYFTIYIGLTIFLGSDAANLINLGSRIGGEILTLANSRSAEEEADTMSFEYLKSTKYYPGALESFFILIEKKEKEKGGINPDKRIIKFLSTHPLNDERIAENAKRLKSIGNPKATRENLYTERYQVAMKRAFGEED
ncbi:MULTISPECIES: M48 family metalloprotease [Leptospira]|uniref:Peptidase, M48 family n=1 Tax=Leptospira weilii str. UI 13098 TaxID=1088542 RepID=M6Q959_9LEPT|nr:MULTISPECIES: M48 family metalloprotease [Leptospira]EMJ60801.1 peptidase, M48 family [Leptospira sp. P2653]EMN89720.1 peptidase, M48 family [Leptospira weilii str. UI 13098]OMI18320.1 peptidase M48 [Leptospira weilii serovar Heyan]ULH30238.1 M48 family metalloprotease [Leptospira weilii]UPY78168.1 M48 family metalloprotease [Leptospira weilii]